MLAFLRGGLGWGHMPLHMVAADLKLGTLVEIQVPAAEVLGEVGCREAEHPVYELHLPSASPGARVAAWVPPLPDDEYAA
jgi:hypothetical protein